MANKPLRYRPDAVPTPLGWAHEMTGEQLTSHRNLEPAEGTKGYHPNNRKWMAEFNEGEVPPTEAAPANTAVPVITGTTALGDTLTATAGTWTGTPAPTFAYQWTRNGTNIAGATATTYVITAADQGTNIAVKVTGTNSAGNATATSADTAVPEA